MRKRILPLIRLLLLLTVIVLAMLSCLNRIEPHIYSLFVSKEIHIWNSGQLTTFTAISSVFAGIFSVFTLPFYIMNVVDPEYIFPKPVYIVEDILRKNLAFVTALTFVAIFSCGIIGMKIEEIAAQAFSGDDLYAHLLLPLCYIALTLMHKRDLPTKTQVICSCIPTIAYAIQYLLMFKVFGLWGDNYHFDDIAKVLNLWAIPVCLSVIIVVNVTINFVDYIIVKNIKKR